MLCGDKQTDMGQLQWHEHAQFVYRRNICEKNFSPAGGMSQYLLIPANELACNIY
jgi:hypothetical protein